MKFPLFSRLKKLSKRNESFRDIRILIIRDLTIEPLDVFLKYLASIDEINLDVKLSNYNEQIRFNEKMKDYIHSFDHIFIFSSFDIQFLNYPFSINEESSIEAASVLEICKNVISDLIYIRKHSQVPITLFTPMSNVIHESYTFNRKSSSMNPHFTAIEKLRIECKDINNLFLEDLYFPVYELGRENALTLSKMTTKLSLFSLDALELISLRCNIYLKRITQKYKKVLVLDCDNTLWGGIAGESAIDKLQLGQNSIGNQYQKCQSFYKYLNQLGIILCICSKNNLQTVLDVFEKHPEMILKQSDITEWKVGWNNKANGLIEISKDLNLSLDSFVFVDDSFHELEAVKLLTPEVSTIQCSKINPLDVINCIVRSNYFPLLNSDLDTLKDRSISYEENRSRKVVELSSEDIFDYIRKLKIQLFISDDISNKSDRIYELINRTNQFNLTTKRLSIRELRERINKPQFRHFTLSAKDKFGDLGVIGYLELKQISDKIFEIDTFLLSCRAFGRLMEKSFIHEIFIYLRILGCEELRAKYIPTKKNRLVENFYEDVGFKLIDQLPCGMKSYSMKVTTIKEKYDHELHELYREFNNEKCKS